MGSGLPELVLLVALLLATAGAPLRLRAPPPRSLAGAPGGGPAALPRPRLAGPALALPDRLRRRRRCAGWGCCWRWRTTTGAGTWPPVASSSSRSPSPASGSPSPSAAAVDVLQRRRERGLRRAYVFALPLLLYAAWYAGWGIEADNGLTAHNVLVSPALRRRRARRLARLAARPGDDRRRSRRPLEVGRAVADRVAGRWAPTAVSAALASPPASGRRSRPRRPSGSWRPSTRAPAASPTPAATSTSAASSRC